MTPTTKGKLKMADAYSEIYDTESPFHYSTIGQNALLHIREKAKGVKHRFILTRYSERTDSQQVTTNIRTLLDVRRGPSFIAKVMDEAGADKLATRSASGDLYRVYHTLTIDGLPVNMGYYFCRPAMLEIYGPEWLSYYSRDTRAEGRCLVTERIKALGLEEYAKRVPGILEKAEQAA